MKWADVTADTTLVTPGPAVTTARPGERVRRPVPSAAKAAVASWRTSISRGLAVAAALLESPAAATPAAPPTAASYSGNTWAPDRVNSEVTPCARAARSACTPPCSRTSGSSPAGSWLLIARPYNERGARGAQTPADVGRGSSVRLMLDMNKGLIVVVALILVVFMVLLVVAQVL